MESLALKKGTDGLPFPQYYNSSINDYEDVQGSGGATYVLVKNTPPIDINIANSGIYVPIDLKGVDKSPIYTYDSTSEASGNIIQTVGFDFSSQKNISGIICSDQSLTYYIQESTNQSEWFTTSKNTITPSSSETIGATSYYNATSFNVVPSLRYVKMIFVVGSTALTKLSIQVFSSTL